MYHDEFEYTKVSRGGDVITLVGDYTMMRVKLSDVDDFIEEVKNRKKRSRRTTS